MFSVTPFNDFSDRPKLDGREKIVSVSVAGCFQAVVKQKGWLFLLVETLASLCEAAPLTASSNSTFSRSVTTSMSFPCLATIDTGIFSVF